VVIPTTGHALIMKAGLPFFARNLDQLGNLNVVKMTSGSKQKLERGPRKFAEFFLFPEDL